MPNEFVGIGGGQTIQYITLDRGRVAVYLRPAPMAKYKKVGVIRPVNATRPTKPQGWQYVPCGQSQRDGGEIFADLIACKRSVEGRDKPEEFTPAFAVAGMNPNDWKKNETPRRKAE